MSAVIHSGQHGTSGDPSSSISVYGAYSGYTTPPSLTAFLPNTTARSAQAESTSTSAAVDKLASYGTYRSPRAPSTPSRRGRDAGYDSGSEGDVDDDDGDADMDEEDDIEGDDEMDDRGSSSSSSCNSAVLLTPPGSAMPVILSDLLPSGPKRKRSITHLSGIPIELIESERSASQCDSPSLRAQRPIRGLKRVAFVLPSAITTSAGSAALAEQGVGVGLGIANAPTSASQGARVSLGSLMRRMSVAPELRACSARNGTIGAGQGRDAGPGVGACSGDGELREYAETSPEASMEVNEYDSDEESDDDLIIVI